ncbi:autotransporter outer membrane beta-barrel domain-containing protein [Acidithiobacillus ferrianus]|uniref:Autotransporter domain-containing protein n=2 Tax=Acidithiobacillus ferrianus TaxID=2678518 RepID=A0A845UFY0_9PROT|nr:autotransporter outer membrane beta-barrel domain-containing protein [Acidithiobacillus ferrianus]NDU43500.1 hypothetical protein [Acidithiobacillus ferrianus]
MKTKQMQLKPKTLILALALALAAPAADATAYTGQQTITQNTTVTNSDTWTPTSTAFNGTGGASPVLDFNYNFTPLAQPGSISASSTVSMGPVSMATNGTIEADPNSSGISQFLIDGSNAAGGGALTVEDLSTSQNPYADLQIVGNQALGASALDLGAGMSLTIGDGGGTPTSETLGSVDMKSASTGTITMLGGNLSTLSLVDNGQTASTETINGYGSVSTDFLHGGMQPTETLQISGGGPDTISVPNGAAFDVTMGGGDANNMVILPEGATTEVNLDGILTLNNGNGTLSIESGNTGQAIFTSSGGSVDGNVSMAGAASYLVLVVDPVGSTGLSISGGYSQTGGSLEIPISPAQAWGMNVAGSADITGGNLIINGEKGAYTNGHTYTLINAGTLLNFKATPYYVYNGASGNSIDGLNPYLKTTTTQVDLCLGSTCVAQPAKAQPAPSQPSQPIIPAAPVIPVVHVVTPVQEAKPVLADSAGVTQAAIQNTAQTLVSTGVVGGGPRGVWLKTLGGFSSQSGYSGMNYGLLTGYGKSVGPDGRDVFGVAFSAGQAGLGTGASDFTRASDYGLWAYGTYYPLANRRWKITGAVGGGLSQNTLESTALGLPQVANFGGGFMGTEVRASYWKTLSSMDNIIVSPRLSVGCNQSWTGGYSTHGGGPLDVAVSGQSDGQLYLSPAILVGKKFNYRSQSGNHTIFPQVRLGAVENIGPNPSAEISSGQVAGQVQGLAYPHLQGMAEARLDVISHTSYSKGLMSWSQSVCTGTLRLIPGARQDRLLVGQGIDPVRQINHLPQLCHPVRTVSEACIAHEPAQIRMNRHGP